MLKRTTVICIFAFLGGCVNLPEHMQDCEIAPYVQQWETVEECKMAVLKKEDRDTRRQAEDEHHERMADRCWREQRGMYQRSNGVCYAEAI